MDTLKHMKVKLQKERLKFVFAVMIAVLFLDQMTKIFARLYLVDHGSERFFFNLINIEYAENPGAFLSVGAEMSDQLRFLIFSVGVFFVLIWAAYLLTLKQGLPKSEIWGLSFLLAGGVGNLIDRLQKGTVTDFVQVGFEGLQTGIFNLADMAILGGVILILIAPFFEKKKSGQLDPEI